MSGDGDKSACPSEEQLAGYAAGDGGDNQAAALEAHLKKCTRCRRWVDRAKTDGSWLRGVRNGAGSKESEQTARAADRESNLGQSSKTDEPSPDAAVQIEGYQITRELHRGGQGVVYQAIQKSTKRKVALKVMLEGPFASERSKRRFEREIELVASLHHPNIVAVFDSGIAHGKYWYAMDYIRGRPLNPKVR